MFLSVVLLSLLTLLFLGLIRRLRGRLVLTDLVIPLLCLSPGQWENFLQGWNLQNVMFAFLSGLCLLILIRQTNLRFWQQLGLLVLLTLLPWVSGGAGVILALGLAVALIVRTLCRLMAGCYAVLWNGQTYAGSKARPFAAAADGTILVSAILSLLCTRSNLEGVKTDVIGNATPGAIALNTAEVLVGPFIGRVPLWNHPVVWLALVSLLVCVSLLSIHLLRRDGLCDRTWLIGGFLGSCAIAAVLVAWARSDIAPDFCQISRYTTIFLPLAVAVYLLLVLTGTAGSRVAQRTILVCVLIALPFKAHEAIAKGHERLTRSRAFEEDVRQGKPSSYLADHHDWLIPTWWPDRIPWRYRSQLFVRLELLRAHGLHPFESRQATPADLPSAK